MERVRKAEPDAPPDPRASRPSDQVSLSLSLKIMNNRISIVIFMLLLFSLKDSAFCSAETNGLENIGKESYQELYRLSSKDKSVTAIWFGEDPRKLTESSNTLLEFGVKELIFQFSEDNKKIKFEPGGELYHDCWSFNIFSEDGRNVVLLQSHYGPYHVIKIENLRNYLTGKAPPLEIVKGNDPDSDGGVIHDTLHWISNDTFAFTAACCGDERIVRHKIGNKTTRCMWKNEKALYTLVAFVLFFFFITVLGIAVIIKYFRKKNQ